METLAQAFAIYCIVLGAVMFLKRKTVIKLIADLAKQRSLLLVLGCIELLAGAWLALYTKAMSSTLETALFVLGVIMVIEAIIYVTASEKFIRKIFTVFNRPAWYFIGGLISIAFGVWIWTL